LIFNPWFSIFSQYEMLKVYYMVRNIILVCVIVGFSLSGFGQMPGSLKISPFFSPSDSQKVFISINGSSFFKNNEYFSPIELGYTLLGFYAEPTITLQITRDLRMQGGAGFLKYSGKEGIYKTEPVFRLMYQPFTNFQMVLGNLNVRQNHHLLEPFYRWERQFTNPNESGIQFLYQSERLSYADIWLNWEKFIMPGDPFQEELTAGISSEWKILKNDGGLQIHLPFQTVFRHQGGQINSVDTPLVTLANWATGIKFSKITGNRVVRFWEASVYYLGFSDLSPQKLQQFRNGYGIYPKVKIGIFNFSAEAGYFTGKRLISPLGERLFHSATFPASGISNTRVNLLTGKFWFEKTISEGIVLGTYFESYSNIKSSLTDYCYGVHIVFNHDFFVTKFSGD
jgi:hypothetical protein